MKKAILIKVRRVAGNLLRNVTTVGRQGTIPEGCESFDKSKQSLDKQKEIDGLEL